MAENFALAAFNAIKNDAASGLADLPDATIENLTTLKTILNSQPNLYNEYVEEMVQRIGRVLMRGVSFSNPFAAFTKGENPMGHIVQNIYFEPLHAEDNFDGKGNDVFSRRSSTDKVTVAYHQLNYQPRYVVTVDRVGLMNALASWEDLDRFWGAVMASLYTGVSIDEYTATRKVITEAIASTTEGETLSKAYIGTFNPKDESSGKAFVQSIKHIAASLSFPNKYNQAGVVNVTRPEDLVLFVNKDISPNLDTYTLASVFHTELVKIPTRVITVDTFSNDETAEDTSNILGVLTTSDWLQVYNVMQTTRPIENPQGLYTNFFLHVWKTIQLDPYAPAIVLIGANS